MGSPQQQAATAIANLLGRVGRFAVVVGIGGGIAQSSLYTGDLTTGLCPCAMQCTSSDLLRICAVDKEVIPCLHHRKEGYNDVIYVTLSNHSCSLLVTTSESFKIPVRLGAFHIPATSTDFVGM